MTDVAAAAPRPAPGARSEESKTRTLVVGDLAGLASEGLEASLVIEHGAIDDAIGALRAGTVDLVLLDGRLPTESLTRFLESVGPAGGANRAAIVVLTEEGRRTNVESRLIGVADDFVNGSRGPDVLLARAARALGVRAALQELSRKNAALESLYARVEALAARMGDELRLAAHLQRGLLPPAFTHPRLEVAREFLPFREIGGDYYDLVPLSPDRIVFALGDVMGKGVPAALLAANLKACLRAQLQAWDGAPEDLVARVNRLFWEITPKGLFASLVFGVLDLAHGTFEYVNAGHDHPFLVREGGGVQDLDVGGTVLGLLEGSTYERGQIDVRAGDVLVFYSDGVSDRADASGDSYGVARLREAALRTRRDGARIALYSLLGEVQGWAGGSPAEDDMTLVVAKLL